MSPAACHLASGFFASAFWITQSKVAGTAGSIDDGGGGSVCRTAAMTPAALPLSNARRPVAISYMTAPNANRSDADVGVASLEPLGRHVLDRAEQRLLRRQPLACDRRAIERHLASAPRSRIVARPKSSTFTPVFVSMMFAGFRSRWTTP